MKIVQRIDDRKEHLDLLLSSLDKHPDFFTDVWLNTANEPIIARFAIYLSETLRPLTPCGVSKMWQQFFGKCQKIKNCHSSF